jgi:hypothetical protein
VSGSAGKRIDWAACPFVTVDAVTCAHCGSPDYISVRSMSNGDGSRTRLAICQSCKEPYKICVEIPEIGNVTWPVDLIEHED